MIVYVNGHYGQDHISFSIRYHNQIYFKLQFKFPNKNSERYSVQFIKVRSFYSSFSEFQSNRSNSFSSSPKIADRRVLNSNVEIGLNIATLFWYALYAGYLLAVMDSVKFVEDQKRRHKETAGEMR
jgi:hypothetical protein